MGASAARLSRQLVIEHLVLASVAAVAAMGVAAGLLRLLQLTRDDDLIDLEFNVICRQEGYPVIETPIFSTTRHSGGSTTDLRAAFRLYRGALQLRDRMNVS